MYKLLIISTYYCSGGSGIAQTVVDFEDETARDKAFGALASFYSGASLNVTAVKL